MLVHVGDGRYINADEIMEVWIDESAPVEKGRMVLDFSRGFRVRLSNDQAEAFAMYLRRTAYHATASMPPL